MKKINFISIIAAALLVLISCENFNEKNFSGYDNAAIPKNVVSYTYTLADADYATISKAALALATTKNDSNKAKAISTNKYFLDTIPANKYLPLLLNSKYLYSDANSIAMVTYNYNVPYDTTKIAIGNKFVLADEDYSAMGSATGQPGKLKNFSSTIDPNYYIPIWLKIKFPYSKSGEVKMVRYKFFVSSSLTNVIPDVFIFDGASWVKYKSVTLKTDQCLYSGKTWVFDPTIYITQITNDRTKDAEGYPSNMNNMFSVIVHAVKADANIAKYISSFKNDEYYYGASAYQGNFSFQYSVREAAPYSDPALIALTNEADKINFMFNRVNEAIIIYLKYAYPTLNPKTDAGFDQYLSVTFRVYERYASGTNTNTYKAKFQCIETGKFKFIERVKL